MSAESIHFHIERKSSSSSRLLTDPWDSKRTPTSWSLSAFFSQVSWRKSSGVPKNFIIWWPRMKKRKNNFLRLPALLQTTTGFWIFFKKRLWIRIFNSLIRLNSMNYFWKSEHVLAKRKQMLYEWQMSRKKARWWLRCLQWQWHKTKCDYSKP